MKGKLTPEIRERQKYLWNTGFHFGEWATPTPRPGGMFGHSIEKEIIATSFYAYSAYLLAKMSVILGKKQAASYYDVLSQKVKMAFNDEYVGSDGRLLAHYQGMYVIALQFDMVPEPMRAKLASQLVGLIRDNDDRLDTGFLATPFLLDVLKNTGYEKLASTLLFQNKCPSWLYEVEKGATTMWETWNDRNKDGSINAYSYNHYAYGAVGDWMYRNIGGIQKDAPAYKHIIICPVLVEKLTYAKANHHSIYGDISTRLSLKDSKIELEIIIPPNTTASVHLPMASLSDVTENGVSLEKTSGILEKKQVENKVVLEVGSGHYIFAY